MELDPYSGSILSTILILQDMMHPSNHPVCIVISARVEPL